MLRAASLKIAVIDAENSVLDSLVQEAVRQADIEITAVNHVRELVDAYAVGARREVSVSAHAARQASQTSFDLLLLCGADALDSAEQEVTLLAAEFPRSPIALVAQHSQSFCDFWFQGNVAGIVPASYEPDQLVGCLKLISTGVRFLPAELHKQDAAPINDGLPQKLEKKLTPRQREVLKYVSLGKSNKYIAAELSLCESTVKVHVHEVMKRLGATSRTHASYMVNSRYQSDNGFARSNGAQHLSV